jgi:hypothetical protein
MFVFFLITVYYHEWNADFLPLPLRLLVDLLCGMLVLHIVCSCEHTRDFLLLGKVSVWHPFSLLESVMLLSDLWDAFCVTKRMSSITYYFSYHYSWYSWLLVMRVPVFWQFWSLWDFSPSLVVLLTATSFLLSLCKSTPFFFFFFFFKMKKWKFGYLVDGYS